MGDVLSKSTEFVVDLVCTNLCAEVHHICRLDNNLEALKKAMVTLQGRRNDVLNWVQREEEDPGLQRLDGVQVWLRAVETIENEVHEMQMACEPPQGLSLCEVCSTKLASRFRYGKEVVSMLEDVKELIATGGFKDVTAPAVRDVVEEMDLLTIVGQKAILKKAWSHLMDGETKMMGLYGMGGVGKTTLLEQINNKFKDANDGFEKVIWVVVSKNLRIESIQDEIAEKLGLATSGGEWKQKEKRQKATDIRNRLKKKKFVLLLDDIWEEVDLKEMGVPFPTRENGCKVVFTTRFLDVCGRMGVGDDAIEVKCLESEEAWDLFSDKVGRNTLKSNPHIIESARKVATKCRGLPLALIIIGKNMASKTTVQEWDDAFDTLSSSAAQFRGMEDHIFSVLMYSYDSLRGDHVKSCFQYCALFPEDSLIAKEKLVYYWICEGFIDEKKGMRKAMNKAHGIIGTLVQACLLIEDRKDKSYVKMHDVIREMALWIANDFGKEDKKKCIVQTGVGLRDVQTVENWGSVRRMSLMNNKIKNISNTTPECPELTTLLLQRTQMETIPGEFFKSIPNLVVLDLSSNTSFNELPEEIAELVSLRYLDLSLTNIERLPGGLLKLIKLIYLSVQGTRLESISGVSKLSSLRTLRLAGSRVSQDLNGMKELQLLEHLEVVTVGIDSILVADQLLNATATRLVNAIQFMYIKGLKGKDSILTSSWNKNPTTSGFPNLSTVMLSECNWLKDVTWLLYAPNLIKLIVMASDQIEEIISKEKAENIFTEEEAGTIIPFQRLEHLQVLDLPKLKSIYWNPLPFPRLTKFSITKCPNLRKLPLDSQSGGSNAGEDLVIQNEEQNWVDEVEWEDEATKERFLPSLQQYLIDKAERNEAIFIYLLSKPFI